MKSTKTIRAICICVAAATGVVTTGATKAHADPIIFLAGPLSDPFFGAVKQGADAAAGDFGVEYQFTAPPDFNDIVARYTRLGEAAIAREPAAFVVGNFFPDAISPLIERAAEADIPVVVYNSGRTNWEDLGAIGFVGEDPHLMGQAAGEAQARAGVTRGVCVNHVVANPVLELRCQGYIDALIAAGGTAEMISIPYEDTTNDQRLQQAIGGVLISDQAVDGVFTLGPSVALNALAAVEASGREITVGTTDLSTAALEAIAAGDLAFAIDQQPFLQGYYGILLAAQFVEYRVAPVGAISTGPFVIDASNVAEILAVSQDYPGIRGAN